MNKRVSVIGYKVGLGGRVAGAELGPEALRERGLIARIKALGFNVNDLGDVGSREYISQDESIFLPEEKQSNHYLPLYHPLKELSEKVAEEASTETKLVILGGDHTVSIGSVAGVTNAYKLRGKKLGLIWIDTHTDIFRPSQSLSKNMHGMSVAFLLGMVPGAFCNLQKNSPAIDPSRFVYVGLRDLDPGEPENIKKMGIRAMSMKDIDIRGLASVMYEAIDHASTGTDGFIVSYDLDVCDPSVIWGTGTKIRGGLTLREAFLAAELVHDSGKMVAFELVELNPAIDPSGKSAEIGVSLIEAALGKGVL